LNYFPKGQVTLSAPFDRFGEVKAGQFQIKIHSNEKMPALVDSTKFNYLIHNKLCFFLVKPQR